METRPDPLIALFRKIGEIKRLKQRGFVLREVADPPTVGAHGFREALMGWIFASMGEKKMDAAKIIKTTLIHDLCAGYAGDFTPYEPILEKTGGGSTQKKLFEKWVHLSKKEKELSYDRQRAAEQKCLSVLLKDLPERIKKEMEMLWYDYEQGRTREGRFVQQIDMLENFLQALEYWAQDATFPIESWWHQIKELLTEPILIEFLSALDKEFHGKAKG
ncbi:HD domain-containing protein [Patescibacteria group bacterium]|nr:HD domain-containing protein [Patescibacteria group bacterium]